MYMYISLKLADKIIAQGTNPIPLTSDRSLALWLGTKYHTEDCAAVNSAEYHTEDCAAVNSSRIFKESNTFLGKGM